MMRRLWNYLPRWLRLIVKGVVTILAVLLLLIAAGYWYLHPSMDRTDGVVYGDRHGQPLTMDVLRPAKSNGLGIVFVVSGGWKSQSAGEPPAWLVAPILRRGYTVFAICHVSQPEATVMEIIDDMQRGVRFVRHHAADYEIDPQRIGISGGSAGGHLSLMLATLGGPGPAGTGDPIDQESSAVQAVAIFYPVTDLIDMGDSTENAGDGGPPVSFRDAFGPDATDLTQWPAIGRRCSPLYHVHPQLPPTLIYHGDADTLVPLEQSERYRDRARELGNEVRLVVHPGGAHGWLSMIWDERKFADWFDEYLPTQR